MKTSTGFSRLAVILLIFILWILACCVQGLGAKGCAFLAVVCKRYPNCDREVLYKRCAHYPEALEFFKKKSYDAISPVGSVKQWPNFPYGAYGPIEKKRRHRQDDGRQYLYNQYVREYERMPRKRERLGADNKELDFDSWEKYFDHDLHDKRDELIKKRLDSDYTELEPGGNTKDFGVIKPEDVMINVDQYRGVKINNDVHETGGFERSNLRSKDADEFLDVRLNKEKKDTSERTAAEFLENQVEQRAILLAEDKDHVDVDGRIDLGEIHDSYDIKSEPQDKKTERRSGLVHTETNVLNSRRTIEEDVDVDAILNKENSQLDSEDKKDDDKHIVNSHRQIKEVVNKAEVESKAEDPENVVLEDSTERSLEEDKKISGPSQKSNDPRSEDKGILVIKTHSTLSNSQAQSLGNKLQQELWSVDPTKHKVFKSTKVHGKDVRFHMVTDSSWFSSKDNAKTTASKINKDKKLTSALSKQIGISVLGATSPKELGNPKSFWFPEDKGWDKFAVITAIVGGTTLGLIIASVLICTIKRSKRKKPIEVDKQEAVSDYQELCRTQMAVNSGSPDSVKSLQADRQRHGLINGYGKVTRRTWGEEPVSYNMDISTGHVVLSYLESHLKNEDRLSKEWEALCNYRAEPDETTVGSDQKNPSKNRYKDILPYDHTRVKLRETTNATQSDYINASFITDANPKNPAYLATQGPLETTVSDFWQMIWEQGIVVIVNLTRLSDLGLPQCHRYWPEEGSEVYHVYEVHLISEHIWCEDYLVRSFYLKNLQTGETRTVTQFHFLTWPDLSVPENSKPLLEFRRKVNKCYRGQSCPIVVHCSNGVGRTGTYILIDMVLNKMIKGAKEIDIAATLEHLRDQRPDMVKTKAQFEFVLAAVAEEVTAILSSLPS